LENRDIKKLLKRYLLGNADTADNSTVDNWYNSFDNKTVELSDKDAAAIGNEIWEKIEAATADYATATPARVRRMPSWVRVAAAVLLIAGAGSIYLWRENAHAPQFATISTHVGEKKIITLPDGSILTLDAGTTIRVQNDASKDRNVEIADGQVFFDVRKDDQHPFVIRSGELTTTVLGTSFAVSAYQGLHDLNIGVVTGKIKVQSDTNTLAILEKNQELTYDKSTKAFRTIVLDESMTAWQQGRLVMNDLGFTDMAVLMQKNFGVTITTSQDAVKKTKYTIELLRSMTAEEAIEVLAAIHHLKIKKQDNKFFLYK